MTTNNAVASVVNKTLIKEEKHCVTQELFDLKTILNKVEAGNVSEPCIPTKSSTEILSELFGAFNAEPPKIPECVEQVSENGYDVVGRKVAEEETSFRNKKNKKSKKKHKHKEKKHKKKTKSSKKQGSSEDSDDTTGGGRKHKHPSERKKKKKKKKKKKVKDTSVSEPKLMPVVEPVSVKITTNGSKSVKRTVECLSVEPGSGTDAPPVKDSGVSLKSEKPIIEQTASSQVKTKVEGGMPPAATHLKQMTTGENPA